MATERVVPVLLYQTLIYTVCIFFLNTLITTVNFQRKTTKINLGSYSFCVFSYSLSFVSFVAFKCWYYFPCNWSCLERCILFK